MKAPLCPVIQFLIFLLLQQPGSGQSWTVYFGNLHSHTAASDGVDDAHTAYEWAKQQGHLDFLCLSEHNHIVTQAGLTGDEQSAEAEGTAQFVGLVGQEFSTLPPKGGNHINLHDVLDVVPASLNNNYREVFHTWLPAYAKAHPDKIVVAQFNHPANIAKDYGITAIGGFQNYHGDWGEFVSDLDPWVRLIAIISGPADSNMKKSDTPPVDAHREVTAAMRLSWLNYLDHGMHLGPVADQDNHRHSWGTRTTARTGVWIKGAFTKDALLKALQNSCCFATEDKNLSVWFGLEGQPMGSRVADPGAKNLKLDVTIEDKDEPNSAYQIEVLRGKIGSGNIPTAVIKNLPLVNKQAWTTNLAHAAGQYEFYLVHVKQTHAEISDEAWTAPIWIDPALAPEDSGHTAVSSLASEAPYAGSKYSTVYHFSECSALKKLNPQNILPYNVVPPGKTLHKNCPTE